ncbi:MAG: hypothetical protein QN229_01475 [Desulfurococcaceae archaeon TW002]
MITKAILKAILLISISVALAIVGDTYLILFLSTLLWCLLLLISRRVMVNSFKAVLLFNSVYLISSLLIQTLIIGFVELLPAALIYMKFTSLSMSSIAAATTIYPLVIRRARHSWSFLTLLIATRSVTESYVALRDTLDAIRLNYCSRRSSLSLGAVRIITESLPVLMLDTVMRRFEWAITMIPRTKYLSVEKRC